MSAEDALKGLRNSIADLVEASRTRSILNESNPLCNHLVAAIETCLMFHVRPGVSVESMSELFKSVTPGASKSAPGNDQLLHTWIKSNLNYRQLIPACIRLVGPICAPSLVALYEADSIMRTPAFSSRFITLVNAVEGLQFKFAAEDSGTLVHGRVDVARAVASELENSATLATKASTGSLWPSSDAAGSYKFASSLTTTSSEVMHEPLHPFWDSFTEAADARAGRSLWVSESSATSSEAHTGKDAPAVLADPPAYNIVQSLILNHGGRSDERLAAVLAPSPLTGPVVETPYVGQAQTEMPQKSVQTSSWDFSAGISNLLAVPIDAVLKVIGARPLVPVIDSGPEIRSTRTVSRSHNSVFGVPLAAVIHDPYHCVHALLDHRLCVPEVVHACNRRLHELNDVPPPGLGVVQPPPDEVLALADIWDATSSLPPSLSAEDEKVPSGLTMSHEVAQLVRYYLLCLPQKVISGQWSDAVAEIGHLSHYTLPARALMEQEASRPEGSGDTSSANDVATCRMISLRSLINKLPVEVCSLLCELVPLLGWMVGVSADGEHWDASKSQQAHLAALSHVWSAALMTPLPSATAVEPRSSSVSANSGDGATSALVDHHVRGSMQAFACLVVSWRYVLCDALRERTVWQAALMRRLHRLSVIHRMLELDPSPADPTSKAASVSSHATETMQAPSLQHVSVTIHPHLAVRSKSWSAGAPNCEELLRVIWKNYERVVRLVTTVETGAGFERTGPFWRSLGFQTSEPLSDASRSRSRCLGLLCFAYLSDLHYSHVSGILARMHGYHGKERKEAVATVSFYPFAYCVLLITRMLAEGLDFHGSRIRNTGQEQGRVFSPLLVATVHPDFWVLTATDDNADPHYSQHVAAEDVANAADMRNEFDSRDLSISAAFARVVCLAAFILDARWCAGGANIGDLPSLLALSVEDTLTLLPLLASDTAAAGAQSTTSSSPGCGLDVLTALSLWRHRSGVGLATAPSGDLWSEDEWSDAEPCAAAGQSSHNRLRQQSCASASSSTPDRHEMRRARSSAAAIPNASLPELPEMDSTSELTTEITSTPLAHLTSTSGILSNEQASALEAALPKALRGYDWVCAYSLALHGASVSTLLQRTREHPRSLVVIQDSSGGVFGGFAGERWTGRSAAVGRYFGNGQSFVFSFTGCRSAFNLWRAQQLEQDAAAEHAAILSTMRDHHDSPHVDTEIQLQTPPPSIFAAPPEASSGSSTDSSGGGSAISSGGPLNVYRWSRRNKYFQLAGPDGIGMGGGGSFAWYLDGDLDKGSSGLCETFLSPCLSAERERFTALRVEVWCFRRRTAVW